MASRKAIGPYRYVNTEGNDIGPYELQQTTVETPKRHRGNGLGMAVGKFARSFGWRRFR